MSDSLRNVFKIPKEIRSRLSEGAADAQSFLDNADLLKKMGLMNEQDEGDMKSLVEMAKRITSITSDEDETEPQAE